VDAKPDQLCPHIKAGSDGGIVKEGGATQDARFRLRPPVTALPGRPPCTAATVRGFRRVCADFEAMVNDSCGSCTGVSQAIRSCRRSGTASDPVKGSPSRLVRPVAACQLVLDSLRSDPDTSRRFDDAFINRVEGRSASDELACIFAQVVGHFRRRNLTEPLHYVLDRLRLTYADERIGTELFQSLLDAGLGPVPSTSSESRSRLKSSRGFSLPDSLFLRYLTGDPEALACILVQYARPELVRYMSRHWRRLDAPTQEDALQEVSLGVLRVVERGRSALPQSVPALWRYLVAALNNCIRRMSRRTRGTENVELDWLRAVPAERPTDTVWSEVRPMLLVWSARLPSADRPRLHRHGKALAELSLALGRLPHNKEIERGLAVSAATASRLRWDLVEFLRSQLSD